MSISRFATIITAGLSSAASFYILTRSGMAGTLVGALVSGIVYNVTSLGLNHGLSKSGRLLKPQETQSEPTKQGADEPLPALRESLPQQPAPAGKAAPTRWLPMALGAAALVVSIWAATDDGSSILVRERIVEQPVVQERIVVQTVTVTAGPDARTESPGAGTQSTPGSSTTETSDPTTTTHDPSTPTTGTSPTTTTVQVPSEEIPANPGTPEEPLPSS